MSMAVDTLGSDFSFLSVGENCHVTSAATQLFSPVKAAFGHDPSNLLIFSV